MLGSGALEVAIGIVLTYALTSLACTALVAGIEAFTNSRAAYLEYAIRELLHDTSGAGLARHFYDHPLIRGLYCGDYHAGRLQEPGLLARGYHLPAHVPASTFALALLDLAGRDPKAEPARVESAMSALSLSDVRTNLSAMQNPFVQRVLLVAIDAAEGNSEAARRHIEQWYEGAVDRVTRCHERSTRWVLFWIALTIAVAGNVDTLRLASFLYWKGAAPVEAEQRLSGESAPRVDGLTEARARASIGALPIGWSSGLGLAGRDRSLDIASSISGWVFTALLATAAAMLWLGQLRRAVAVPATARLAQVAPVLPARPLAAGPAGAGSPADFSRPYSADRPPTLPAPPQAGVAWAVVSLVLSAAIVIVTGILLIR